MSKRHKNKVNLPPKKVVQYSKGKVDVVITTAGRFDVLEKCLDAVYQEAQLIPLNIIIIDNGSSASERQANNELFIYHKEKDPLQGVADFKVERLPKNVGFPMGANTGGWKGHAPLIMFLSDDVILQSGAIEKIVNMFNEQTIGVVGAKLLFPPTSPDPRSRPPGKVQHVGLALNIRADPIHPLIGWSPAHPKTQQTRDVFAVTGACFTIRRELFQKVNGFDLVYGRGTYEDVDLCLKVKQLGFRIVINAEAIGYHYVGATADKRREPFPLQQNNMIFKSRWANTPNFVWDEWIYW